MFQFAVLGQEPEIERQPVVNLLKLLGISPSSESIDYVQNKTQFQLHTLLTEQRHKKTWNLSEIIRKDYEAGLKMLFAVDEDIENKLAQLLENQQKLDLAAQAVEEAVLKGNKIYVYGCGATGRLAKQMESTFWRPFWNKVKDQKRIWKKLKGHLSNHMEDQLIGEMTGADRALISSLEGFEDLLVRLKGLKTFSLSADCSFSTAGSKKEMSFFVSQKAAKRPLLSERSLPLLTNGKRLEVTRLI
jgi:hypothetical protein